MKKQLKFTLLSGCTAVALMGSAPAFAQDADGDRDVRKLDVVTVTSQKREQSLQDVPISVTAVTGDTLEDNAVTTFQDFGERVPNLKVQVAEGGPANLIGIRGITSGFNRGFEQSVGIVVDGVYNARGEFFRNGLVDIERMEVLRGPQGTLFGKNATAGLINITTADPTDEFEASLKTRLGSDDLVGATGVVSGPIFEGLSGRLVYNYAEQDAFLENTASGPDGGAYETNNLRLKLLAEPTDDLTIRFTYDSQKRDVSGSTQQIFLVDDDPAAGFFGFNPALNIYDPGNGGAGFIPIFGVSSEEYLLASDPNADFFINGTTSTDAESFYETETDNIRLQADYEIGDYTLTYVGGYIDLTDNNLFDPDFSANPYLFGPANVKSEQTTHEIRLQSPVEDRFHWTAGLYSFALDYSNSPDAFVQVPIATGVQPIAPGSPVALPLRDFDSFADGTLFDRATRVTKFEEETEAWAVFAQGTFEATDRLRFTVGGRYTDETKESDQFITIENGTRVVNGVEVGVPTIPGVTFIDTDGDTVPDYQLTASQFGQSFDTTVEPFCFSDSPEPRYEATLPTTSVPGQEGFYLPCGPGLEREESKFTPMFNVQYDFTDNINGYFSWSEGFKGGGFNAQARKAESLEFEEETVEAFEVGLKSVLFDGTMTANVAIYSSTYEDYQTTQFVNQVFIVGNAAEVTAEGIEVDVLWQATDRLRIGFTGAYSNPEYDSFPTAACTNNQQTALSPFAPPGVESDRAACRQDLAGRGLDLAPEYSGNLAVNYDIPLQNLPFDAELGADFTFTDEYFLTQDLDPLTQQDAYSTINLRAALRDKDERWELAALGKNITDEIYLLTAASVPAQNGAYFGTTNRGSQFEIQFNVFFD